MASQEQEALLRRNFQSTAEFHAWRGPFIVRAAMMFNVPVAALTQAQYRAAVEATERDTIPANAR